MTFIFYLSFVTKNDYFFMWFSQTFEQIGKNVSEPQNWGDH